MCGRAQTPSGPPRQNELLSHYRVTCDGPMEPGKTRPVHVRKRYQAPSGPLVGRKNFLRLNASDHVSCDGSDDPSPHEPGRVSEPHFQG